MKVALCLSGQVRSWNMVKESLKKNVIDKCHCDVFCHFAHQFDHSIFKTYYSDCPEEECAYNDSVAKRGSFDDYNIEDVINFLQPKGLMFNPQFFKSSTHNMFYSLMKCNELKTTHEINNNFIYDVVIRARFDLMYHKPLILIPCESNIIHLIYRPGGCGGVNDWFAYGTSQSMNYYTEIYNIYKDTGEVKKICPEGLIGFHLQQKGIGIKFIDRIMNVKRADGDEVADGGIYAIKK